MGSIRGLVVLVALVGAAAPSYGADPPPEVSLAEAQTLLRPGRTSSCADIPCLLAEAYRADPRAKELAVHLFAATGDVAGMGPAELMDGGFRGKIKLVPQLPLGAYRQHLAWVAQVMTELDGWFGALFDGQPAPAYRWRALSLRFVRSPGKRTPSAYAFAWTIEYNVAGSLLTSVAGVRDTLFHELFHANDQAHGDWSATALQRDYDAIVARCGTKVRCLAPYAPNSTMVRATGTYYAFQPNNGNGVHEYTAELAVRYYREQSEMLAGGKLAHPAFKCGPAENARAWKAMVDEFFGGRDLTPAC